jgi:hypothetical protein
VFRALLFDGSGSDGRQLDVHTSSSARDIGLITAILVVIAWAAAALGLGAWRTSTREI